jgi:hypothetical protein
MKLEAKDILLLSSVLFTIVAFFHLFRLVLQTSIVVNGFEMPLWVSGAAVLFAGWLAWQSWRAIPNRTHRTVVHFLVGIFIAKLILTVAFWYYKIDFFRIRGNDYAWAMLFDLVVLGFLWLHLKKWHTKKRKR